MSDAEVVTRVQIGIYEFSIALDPDDVNENFYLEHFRRNLFYEPEVVGVMNQVVRPGDFCIDVGAHVGFFTLILSALVSPIGCVLAFEPGRNNVPKLKHNLALNNADNVRLITQPAWVKNEPIKFYLNSDSSGGNAVWDPGRYPWNEKSRENVKSYEINAVRIDSLTDATAKLVKIDVEGAEARALAGMSELLSKKMPPFVIVEIGPFGLEQLGVDCDFVRTMMEGYGYDLFLMHPQGGLPTLVPRKTEFTHQVNEGQQVVMNVMFSTLDAVAEYWPRAPFP